MIAHLLTGIRLLLVLPAGLAFAYPQSVLASWALAILVVAIITDISDGYAARRFNTASPIGQLFDHTTDFLFVTIGLIGAAYAGATTLLLPLVIIIAFTQYVFDSRKQTHDNSLHMNWLGRWNGILYFAPLVLIALGQSAWAGQFASPFLTAALFLSYLLLATTLLSIADRTRAYFRRGIPGSTEI